MPWKTFAYAALCVGVPAAWGLIVYWISRKIEKRVLRNHSTTNGDAADSPTLPLDYHI